MADIITQAREITQVVIDSYVSKYTPFNCGYVTCISLHDDYKRIPGLFICNYCPFYTNITLKNIHKIH